MSDELILRGAWPCSTSVPWHFRAYWILCFVVCGIIIRMRRATAELLSCRHLAYRDSMTPHGPGPTQIGWEFTFASFSSTLRRSGFFFPVALAILARYHSCHVLYGQRVPQVQICHHTLLLCIALWYSTCLLQGVCTTIDWRSPRWAWSVFVC